MNECPNCLTNAGIQHDEYVLDGKVTHILTCPHCGFMAGAVTIAEACAKWNNTKLAEDTAKR